MSKETPGIKPRDHSICIYMSYELKECLKVMAMRFDRPIADVVRTALRVGLPVLEGFSEAEEEMLKEYLAHFRKWRKMEDLTEL